MTAHGLIMVFFVVVPIIFGGFANFLIPYHVGSKDVAFPRLNSIGFWIQPLGFILVAKIAFLRPQYWHYYDKTSFFLPVLEKKKFNELFSASMEPVRFASGDFANSDASFFLFWRSRKKLNYENYSDAFFNPVKLSTLKDVFLSPESFWFVADKVSNARRRKAYFSKCSNRSLTTSG
jgi:hypothetical protein